LDFREQPRTVSRVSCPHPPEERQRVYEGRLEPRPDRAYCALCGEIIYVAVESNREVATNKVARRARMPDSARHG
jgi:hypothetical protein